MKYWACFSEDKVFKSFLPCFLEHVALLITLDDRLFSTKSAMLPMYYPSEESCNTVIIKDAVQVMAQLKMPFLDTSIVAVEVDCPTISDHTRVLTNIVHIHKASPLTEVLKISEIKVLIGYFSSELVLKDSLDLLQSLPLFETITGSFEAIKDRKAYIWPNSTLVGYQSWSDGLNVVFIEPHSCWAQLGSPEQFSIQNISEVQLYNEFIFPHFEKMSENSRYDHLKHIRDNLFQRNIPHAFKNNLMDLKCIGSGNSDLLPICSFCDHKKNIFSAFSRCFQLLPKILQSKDWIEFFKKLNLKENLTEDECLRISQEIANGEDQGLPSSKTASSVLLEYLLSDDGLKLLDNNASFLWKISKIPFVFREEALQVNWVTPGNSFKSMQVTLNGSARLILQCLVWTVRPIISLPQACTADLKDKTSLLRKVLKPLGVVIKPSIADVITNIKNISSKSGHSNTKLFRCYPSNLLPPNGLVLSLVDILNENLSFLSKFSDTGECKALSSIPCIPVYADTADTEKVVLVQPSCVVISTACHQYHPFLHSLPVKLSSLSNILQNIGVDMAIKLHHMRTVLEAAFHFSEGSFLDPNTERCVKSAITNIAKLLNIRNETDDAAQCLKPLYLPDSESKLKSSTNLLYKDTPSYFGCTAVDLTGTKYCHFDIKHSDYDGVSALDLCRLLPQKVRPFGMSEKCTQLLDKDCITTEFSETASQLKSSFEDQNNSLAIVEAINKFVVKQNKEEHMKECIQYILSSIKIITISNLKSQVLLKETRKVIGQIDTDFFFCFGDSEHSLYIDADADEDDSLEITTELAEYILNDISSFTKVNVTENARKDLLKFIGKYLKSNSSKKTKLLRKYQIHDFIPCGTELGMEITQLFHYRLDQDSSNIFRPLEYVGYEQQENIIILAQVAHLVPSEEETNFFCRKYVISVSSGLNQTREVSVLELYKFLTVVAEDNSRALLLHDDGDEVIDKKRHICEQLNKIWKLNPELKRKALRRLFLRYHPDKNLNNPEEFKILFLFLQAQISHLDNNEPLDEPDIEFSNASRVQPSSPQTSPRKSDYHNWNDTAKTHSSGEKNCAHRAATEGNAENYSFPFSRDVRDTRNPQEGKRWLKQANIDFGVLQIILNEACSCNGFSHVCFMAHQVAEKALKGGVYALCGLDDRIFMDHELSRYALQLQTIKPDETQGLYQQSQPLEKYYVRTRYPNCWQGCTDTPSDHYKQEDAEIARNFADKVLCIVKSIMP